MNKENKNKYWTVLFWYIFINKIQFFWKWEVVWGCLNPVNQPTLYINPHFATSCSDLSMFINSLWGHIQEFGHFTLTSLVVGTDDPVEIWQFPGNIELISSDWFTTFTAVHFQNI